MFVQHPCHATIARFSFIYTNAVRRAQYARAARTLLAAALKRPRAYGSCFGVTSPSHTHIKTHGGWWCGGALVKVKLISSQLHRSSSDLSTVAEQHKNARGVFFFYCLCYFVRERNLITIYVCIYM